ncbi:hypothetical protein AH04_47 [Erwinia phage AH04]|uniref:Uncharacterized protein n=1 Tax=Erwinia phage AH04 TaxID=2869569 RepID=A0AAE8BUL4_9CAUD|nr:hypothetical protein PQC02_gp267 [Erwinia phage AH04]QZA70532.1 hypothetical protein AH04_47 [Erwinia phage AH04]
MSNKHVVILGQGSTAGTIKIEDHNTGGSLLIKHSVSEAWAEAIDDNTDNPLVELANGLNGVLESGKLSLTLIGNDNLITFKDDDAPILEGGVLLRNIKLNSPYLRNCKLTDVDIPNADNVTIHFSKVDGLYMETTNRIHMVSCYIDDKHGLDNVTKLPLHFLMNKRTGE